MATDTNYGDLLNQLTKDQSSSQDRIDILTQHMLPVAQTEAGRNAIQDRLADINENKEVRAAAAQAISGGSFKASIGAHGELSFSAKSDATLGTTPDMKSYQQHNLEASVQAGKAGNFFNEFNNSYEAIRNETDSLKVTELYANVQGNVTNFIASKQAAVEGRIKTSLGIPALESEIQRNVQMDKDWARERGLPYQGHSTETWAIVNQLDQMNGRVNQMTQQELVKDPEIANAQARLKAMETLVSQKFSLSGQKLKDAADSVKGAAYTEEMVAATATAMGADISSDNVKKDIRDQLPSNPRYNNAMAIGMAKPTELVTYMSMGGVEGKMAENVLADKSSKEMTGKIKDLITNFDTVFPESKLTKEQRAALKPAASSMLLSAKQKEAEQHRVQQVKAQIVFQAMKIERDKAFDLSISSGQWAPPTDPLIAEVPAVIKDIQTGKPDTPVNISAVIGGLDFSGADRAAKVDALANYIYSNAGQFVDSKLFGAPTGYHSIDSAKAMINALAAKAVADKHAATMRPIESMARMGGILGGFDPSMR